jgi:hypothetical protein
MYKPVLPASQPAKGIDLTKESRQGQWGASDKRPEHSIPVLFLKNKKRKQVAVKVGLSGRAGEV